MVFKTHRAPASRLDATSRWGRRPAPDALRRFVLLFASAILLWGTGPTVTAAQDNGALALAPAAGAYAEAVDGARELVLARMSELGIPGVSVAVAIDGEVVWSEGFGLADVENRVPVWPETKFRVASISKALTTAAVGKLHEEGKLDLDAPVQQYVPTFPEQGHPVTTRLLAGHLGGVRHYRGDEFASAVQYDDVVDALVIFQDDSLIAVPGEEYNYSTYGWNLISAVVQSAAGRPFLEYMTETVIQPLGLEDTVAEHADSIIYHRARFYQRRQDGHLVNAPPVNNSNKWAGGGYLSTATDLVKYGSAYFGDDFLEPETVALLTTSQRTRSGELTNYGLGWNVREMEGQRVVYHTGGAMGGSTILMMVPDQGVVVSILANLQSARHVDTARRIAELFAAAPD